MSIIARLPIIQQYIGWYGWSTWVIIGMTGCSLNILLFSSRQFRTTSCCLYFLAASAAMIVSVGIGIIPLIYALNHPNPYNMIPSFCKARTYLLQSSTMMFRWLMVAASIDRYIHTLDNAYFLRFANTRVAFRIILVIIIIWLLLPFYYIICMDIRENVCIFPNPTIRIFTSFFIIVSGCLLPPLFMLICTFLIQHNLTLKRDRLIRLRNNLQQDHANHVLHSRDRQVLLMLFMQIFVYIITNLPSTVSLVYTAFTRDMIKSTDYIVLDTFLGFLANFILYMYPVLSFYLYTLTSRTFRQEFLKMLRSTLTCRHQHLHISQRIQPIT